MPLLPISAVSKPKQELLEVVPGVSLRLNETTDSQVDCDLGCTDDVDVRPKRGVCSLAPRLAYFDERHPTSYGIAGEARPGGVRGPPDRGPQSFLHSLEQIAVKIIGRWKNSAVLWCA